MRSRFPSASFALGATRVEMLERHAATLVLAGLLLAATLIDARTRRIPDALNAVAFAAGLGATFFLKRDMASALIGAGAGYATIFLANQAFRTLRGRDGIGLGDAKLLGALGAWVAWTGLPFVVLIAASGGLLFAALRRIRASEAIAFGPFLGIGGLIVWITQIYGDVF